jgi:hypothetical protein
MENVRAGQQDDWVALLQLLRADGTLCALNRLDWGCNVHWAYVKGLLLLLMKVR